jgi:hypothetical protein
MSITITRRCASTCVAARPMPGAAYMVSAMSLTSRRSESSNSVDRFGDGMQSLVGKSEDREYGHRRISTVDSGLSLRDQGVSGRI